MEEKQDVCVASRCLPTKCFLQGVNQKWAVEESGRQRPNQVIRGNIPGTGDRVSIRCPLGRCTEENNSHFCVIPAPKEHNLNLILGKHQTDPNEGHYTNVLQKYQGQERPRLENCSGLKEVERDVPGPGLGRY